MGETIIMNTKNKRIPVSRKKVRPTILLLVFCILYNSGYVLSYVLGSTVEIISLLTALIISMRLYRMKKDSIVRIKYKDFLLSGIILLSIIMTVMLNYSSPLLVSTLKLIAIISIAFLLANTYSINDFAYVFIRVAKILAIISLLYYITYALMGFAFGFGTVLGENGSSYINGILFFRNTALSLGTRNIGIFWEPGVYASFLLTAMTLQILFFEKIKIFDQFLFTLCVITTGSTSGILLTFLIFILIFNAKVKKLKLFVNIILLLVFGVVFVRFNDIIEMLLSLDYGLFYKLANTDVRTTATRLNSPLINLKIWMQKPIFGWGFIDAAKEYFKLTQASSVDISAQTSTNTQILAGYGLIGLTYTFAWLKSVFKLHDVAVVVKLVVLVLFLLILNKESHTTDVYMWCTLMFLLSSVSKKDRSYAKGSSKL